MAIKKGDFVELEYTGKLEDGTVFDTTNEEVAKKMDPSSEKKFGSVTVCIGEGALLSGIDDFLIGKESGTYTCNLSPEKGFGKKDAKLMKLIPLQKFKSANIKPFRGLEVNVDNNYGVVRTVSGGRVTVDFNHPLAGKELIYEVKVKRIVDNVEEQVLSLLEFARIKNRGVKVEGTDHAIITVDTIVPQQFAEPLNALITRLTPIKTVSYHIEKKKDDEKNEKIDNNDDKNDSKEVKTDRLSSK